MRESGWRWRWLHRTIIDIPMWTEVWIASTGHVPYAFSIPSYRLSFQWGQQSNGAKV